jgi:hypothetical protein
MLGYQTAIILSVYRWVPNTIGTRYMTTRYRTLAYERNTLDALLGVHMQTLAFEKPKNFGTISRFVRVILAQGPC